MKKHIFVWIASLLAVVVLAGTAFSTWILAVDQLKRYDLTLRADDVGENYTFGGAKTQEQKEYTIYLFPSTVYLEDYISYLKKETTVKPEEKYGYITPRLDETGDPVLADGETQYVYPTDSSGDSGYLSTVRGFDNGNSTNSGTLATGYLPTNAREAYNTPYTSGYSSWPSGTEYGYGNPTYDNDTRYNAYYSWSDPEQHNYRNLHRYDRFGFWPTLAKDSGRWLPIKITVGESFSNSFFEQVTMDPLADMGDRNGWYCYSFSLWAYVKHNDDLSYTLPYYADGFLNSYSSSYESVKLSSFAPTAVSQYFDAMQDLSGYADSEGVIRLFPKFSQGKTYNATTANDGGSDAVRITPSYKTSEVLNSHDLYLSYTNESVSFNSVTNIKLAILPNVNLDDYNSMILQVALANRSAGWNFGWSTAYTLSSQILDNLKQNYGDGVYNIYFVLGYVASSGNSNSLSGFNIGESFGFLQGKTLISGGDIDSSLGAKTVRNVQGNSLQKPVMIWFEKVRDIRIIGNIARNTVDEAVVQSQYDEVDISFRLISEDEPIYEIDKEKDKVDNISAAASVQEEYPYCYILRNIDFINAQTPRFQIRFQKQYNSNIAFVSSEYSKKVIFNPKSDGTYEKEQCFVGAFDYFTAETLQVGGKTQMFFSLLNDKSEEDMRGLYDIILICKGQNIYVYAYRHTNIFLKVLAKKPTEETTDGRFITHAGTFAEPNMLLFQKEYPIGVSVKVSDKNEEQGYGSLGGYDPNDMAKPGLSFDACVNWYVRKADFDPLDVVLRDNVTGAAVGYYLQVNATSVTEKDEYVEYYGKYYILKVEKFTIRKNYVFYIDRKENGS